MKNNNKKKYTFVEFLAACEGEDFDKIESSNLEWAEKIADATPGMLKGDHVGDCTKMPATCSLCFLEQSLSEYHTYFFNEEKWRKMLEE